MEPVDLEFWMKRALALAEEASALEEVPVGAVFVHEGKLLAQASNRREILSDATAHAEIVALREYSKQTGQWRLPLGASLVVTLEPCLMCTGALLWSRVDNIYFGCNDGRDAGITRVLNFINDGVYDHRFKVVRGGILAKESSTMLSGFFQRLRD